MINFNDIFLIYLQSENKLKNFVKKHLTGSGLKGLNKQIRENIL